ncbi:FAD/NAD(P)-binding domain-containing protein [Lindgomyces ingoldianus]|uniref:FAD/NAD(P)-binding domain-containing protein n=1 Tax=Lindgomyces ingoldianus TaxID=673940 RepID=A0ACB6R9A8_9PLEO|nr:FAD/NAD(P)-binding domain-containing protein [Lindgomyces ingoldianus]KAF2475908.1 FAD/NAD(P)-binding domain-containing protein [Lindgomyces ingoldianus]
MAPDASPHSTILILGGSYSGISTAHYLLKHVLPRLSSSYQVVLISPSAHAMCRPACPRALISDEFFNQDKLFVDIATQFAQYPGERFRFIHGSAVSLNSEGRTVSIAPVSSDVNAAPTVEIITFYALVIATGASTPSSLLGFNSGGRESLRENWSVIRKALPSTKSIVIAGGGPTGIETAGELGEYLNGRAGWFTSKLENPKVKITVVSAGAQILPILRPGLAKKAEDMLAKFGVTVLKSTRIVSMSPQISGGSLENLVTNTTITLSNGETIETDLYIPATGTTPNTAFIPKALLTADGRVSTDTQTLRITNFSATPRIYSIGDCSSAFRPAVHNILSAVPILVANMKKDLLLAEGDQATGNDRLFKEDTREMQMVPIGRSMGVGAAMGWALPSWMVWLVKGRDYWLWTTGGLWSGKHWAKES